ncbi:hypothetical protein [Burkholderia cepacia]|uniref:hypothetical protein n=1 Tax=Burkholderia cepacia TaxID=292 RepID=UPI0011BFA7B5|nr:hypothetical protein [Burkholderia cepacia]MCE4125213.1 hypothetical protein [Burkholderia cepacia]
MELKAAPSAGKSNAPVSDDFSFYYYGMPEERAASIAGNPNGLNRKARENRDAGQRLHASVGRPRAKSARFGRREGVGRSWRRGRRHAKKDARCRQRARIPVKEVSHELQAQIKEIACNGQRIDFHIDMT